MAVLFSVQGMLCFHLENNFQTEKKEKIILQKKKKRKLDKKIAKVLILKELTSMITEPSTVDIVG